MTDFLAAALQLTSTSDPELNFAAAEEQIELAARRGAELVGLPENFAFMGDDERRLELAQDLAQQCSRFLVTMARRYQVVLLGGGFPVPAGDSNHTVNRAELVVNHPRSWMCQDYVGWDYPSAMTCDSLSSIAISSVLAPSY